MAQEKALDQIGGLVDPKAMPGLGADRTTAQVIADIVADNPVKHGVTLEERKRRAAEQARAQAAEAKSFFEESAEFTQEQWDSLKKPEVGE